MTAWIISCLGCFAIGVILIRKQAKSELERVINDAKIQDDLDDYERTWLKEHRMRKAGSQFCIGCGRVAGLYYKCSDDKFRGISLKRVGRTQKGQDVYKCNTCISIEEQEERKKKEHEKRTGTV